MIGYIKEWLFHHFLESEKPHDSSTCSLINVFYIVGNWKEWKRQWGRKKKKDWKRDKEESWFVKLVDDPWFLINWGHDEVSHQYFYIFYI